MSAPWMPPPPAGWRLPRPAAPRPAPPRRHGLAGTLAGVLGFAAALFVLAALPGVLAP